jgi:hypothetical protein
VHDQLDHISNRRLFLMGRLESYIDVGVLRDIHSGLLTHTEGTEVFKLARLQTDIPGLFNRYLLEGEYDVDYKDQIVIWKKPDELVPLEVLQLACKEFNKTFGVAIAWDDNTLGVQRKQEAPNADKIFKIQEGLKSNAVVFFMSKLDTSVDYIQPIVMIGDEDDPQIVAFLQANSPREFFVSLQKRLSKEFKCVDNDLNKLWESASTGDISGDIQGMLDGPSGLLLFQKDGRLTIMEDECLETSHDWGNVYSMPAASGGGDAVPIPADAPKVEPAKPNKKDLDFTGTPDVKPDKDKPANDNKSSGYEKPAGVNYAKIRKSDLQSFHKKTRIGPDNRLTPEREGEVCIQAPEGMDKQQLHLWFMDHVGAVPEDWKDRPLIPASCLKKMPEGFNIDLKTLKDTTSAAAISVTKAGPKLSKDQVNSLQQDFFPKVMSGNSAAMQNPAEFMKMMEGTPSAAEQLGMKDMTGLTLPWLAWLTLCTQYPEQAAVIAISWQRDALQYRQRCDEMSKHNDAQAGKIDKKNVSF